MIPRPDEPTLLRAVARFLDEGVRPTVDDRGLGFRLRIAAHLLATTAAHLEQAEALEDQAVADLADLLGRPVDPEVGRREALAELQSLLVTALQAGTADRDASLAWLKQSLQAQLALTSPRFDTRADVETVAAD